MLRLAALLLLVAVFLVVLWSFQQRLIFFPFGAVEAPRDAGVPQAQTVTFSTEDGLTLSAWFVPPAEPRERAPTILFLSGNAGNRAMRAPLAAALAARGIATLLVDYRGYGGNPGAPSEEGLARDARAARRYLAGRADIDAARVVYFGESLGTGVAVRLAAEKPPRGLVLRSPFTSLTDVGRHHYPFLPVRPLLRHRFASIDRIAGIRCPVLMIAARHDSIVPMPLSERLFAATTAPKQLLIVDNADHNDFALLAGRQVIDAVAAFVDSAIASTTINR
jgi:fermentation-respiration switch protein FrsA (DUF1100 family)